MKSRQSRFNFDFEDVVAVFLIAAVCAVPVIGIGSTFMRVAITQKALNENCNTQYSKLEVLFAGDSLQKLCQIKEQEVLLRYN